MVAGHIRTLARRIDACQQRHRWLAFPVAVWRKLSDDQVGNLAALLTFYAFLSLFPLLLLLITVLGFALHRDPALQQWVLRSALADFPVIGGQLRGDIHAVGRGPAGLLVGLVGSLLGARGLADAAQNVLNRVWAVPYNRRPGFPWSWLRSYGFIAVVGVGMAATSLVTELSIGVGSGPLSLAVHVLALLAALVIGTLTYWLALRLAIAAQVPGRELWTGAALGALGWQILQAVGGYYISHELRHASALYGAFGLVLGLIAWLYLQARVTLYAVGVDVVRSRRLWPRSLFPPPITAGDRKAWDAAMAAQDRSPREPERPPADAGRSPQDSDQLPAEAGRLPQDANRRPADTAAPPTQANRSPRDPGRRAADAGRSPRDSGRSPRNPHRSRADANRSPADSAAAPPATDRR